MTSSVIRIRRTDEIEAPDLAARLKAAREADKRSLSEICRQIGISNQYWYNIERGSLTTMSLDMLRKIEQVLDVNFGVDL